MKTNSDQRMVDVEMLEWIAGFMEAFPQGPSELTRRVKVLNAIIDGPGVEPVAHAVLPSRFLHAEKVAADEPGVGGDGVYFFRVGWNAYRTAMLAAPSAPVEEWPVLAKPAKVGSGRFHVGVSSRLVVEAAQRQYEYEVTPEKEAARIARASKAIDALVAPVQTVPDGMVLVPKKMPTEMRRAAAEALNWFEPCAGKAENNEIRAERAWDAALAAATQPPKEIGE